MSFQEAFIGDDTLDESYAVALQALEAFAEDIKGTRSNPHPTLFERLTAYPDAIADDPDSDEHKMVFLLHFYKKKYF
jgi:hypothetical protein